MFKNNKELFDFINDIITRLQATGEDGWSNAFKNAMAISFMPGELLGEVRLTLGNFQKTDIPTRLNLEREMEAAIEALDQTLNR
jgi:hypothetical protein